jgi:hypothetical protein
MHHPNFKKAMSLKQYLAAQHIVVSFDGSVSGIVDAILAKEGYSRRLVAAVPYFSTALETVATSDLIATIPSRLAKAFATRLGLRLYAPPIDIRPIRFRPYGTRETRRARFIFG